MHFLKRFTLLFFVICFTGFQISWVDDQEEIYKSRGLVNPQNLNNRITVLLKYSTEDNFIGKDVYGDLEKCYLQAEVAKMLSQAQESLSKMRPDYKLLVFDCVRPRSVQWKMWEVVKGTEWQQYVAPPASGSIHNYGSAVDLTIINAEGKELDMGTAFDYFGEEAQPKLEEKFLRSGRLTMEHINNRKLLKKVMESAGFTQLPNEWWHFNAFPVEEEKRKYKIVE